MHRKPREIRDQIERTRERIGGTVDALRYKADVPLRIQESVRDAIGHAKESLFGRPRHAPAPRAGTAPTDDQVDI
jgi:hypothetical protein